MKMLVAKQSYEESRGNRVEVAVDSVAIPRRQRELSNRVYASPEARAEAQEKAEKLEMGLEPVYPTFTKSMLRPHVTGGFWLGLPIQFCFRNLPKCNAVMTLIDEDGDEYPTIYLVHKIGLTGGWKGFAVAHHLLVGDAVVFQLIQPTTFKVIDHLSMEFN
ncbi:b3 domain-containing protein [Quercus suber]|uniref:B3 domain-containing protein n=1 Tax=Quercus suber TaxID=58331 RepID=A0AAW0MBX1_QUESU